MSDEGFDPLRILAVAETWLGSNSYAFVRAFRRAGHSVSVIPEGAYMASGWRSAPLKAARRALQPLIVRDMQRALEAEAEQFRPHLFFTMKGFMVTPAGIEAMQKRGGVAINFWPDVSVMAHGRWIPKTLPRYDWVFTTKSYGVEDMRSQLGVHRASITMSGFDAETHRPTKLAPDDRERYQCDISFIGTWSPKKERMLVSLANQLPDALLRVWGAQWEKSNGRLGNATQLKYVLGTEYAKAIAASRINLALLSEIRPGSSSGDLTTTRTFEIPAVGGFMLHERNDEVKRYFEEDAECAMFGDADEMVAKIRYYLAHDEERQRIAAAGHRRCMSSGYAIDDRAAEVIAKARELLAAKVEGKSAS